jgi:hypothetical protein
VLCGLIEQLLAITSWSGCAPPRAFWPCSSPTADSDWRRPVPGRWRTVRPYYRTVKTILATGADQRTDVQPWPRRGLWPHALHAPATELFAEIPTASTHPQLDLLH